MRRLVELPADPELFVGGREGAAQLLSAWLCESSGRLTKLNIDVISDCDELEMPTFAKSAFLRLRGHSSRRYFLGSSGVTCRLSGNDEQEREDFAAFAYWSIHCTAFADWGAKPFFQSNDSGESAWYALPISECVRLRALSDRLNLLPTSWSDALKDI